MANNYFGFTHGGTQYGAQASAYPPTQSAYMPAVSAQPTAYTPTQSAYVHQTGAAYTTTPRASTYDYSGAAQASGQYSYTSTPQRASSTYDAASQRAVTKGSNAAGSYVYQTGSSATTYLAPTTIATTTPGVATTKYTNKSGYDAALYSAATTYYQQQQSKANQWGKTSAGATPGAVRTGGSMTFNRARPKPQPKQMQLHYCDVCKISCAGPQTYREHLDGLKHKKKMDAAAKAEGTSSTSRGGQNQLQCKLCDVTCTGTDAYTAHIRGAKHQKVLKLHTILGKPIPSSEPVLVGGATGQTGANTTAKIRRPGLDFRLPGKHRKGSRSSDMSSYKDPLSILDQVYCTTVTTTKAAVGTTGKVITTTTSTGTKKVLATPKITFVGAGQLKSTQMKVSQAVGGKEETETVAPETGDGTGKETTVSLAALQENESSPVGHEYIEEVKNDLGKVVSFQCKLCECKFNDPNAKEMHLKGRRHRLQYKKKVDPNLQVDVKPSIRARKIQEEKLRRQAQKEEFWKKRDEEERWREEMRALEKMQWQGGRAGDMMGGFGPRGHMDFMMMRRPDSSDDRHVMAKHAAIYPSDEELQAVQTIVSTCEKALKLASDHIADIDAPKQMETQEKKLKKEIEKKEEPATEKKAETEETKEEEEEQTAPRALKGVMRVGVLAKGLLLHGDLHVHLVVLCSEKPTRTLLVRVRDNLPKQIETFTEEKYDVQLRVEDAAIIVTSEKEPRASCTITLTSPVMREEASTETEKSVSPPDVLDRLKCLNALAALRHAKWFQARANGLQSCVIVIRILRDLCQRVPTWAPLNEWAMELLVEKCVASGGRGMSPGDALRRVFECIASGVLLPGGPGLYDPCEKEPTDAAAALTNQEREDITASAQHALRLIAFRQIHKVLGMDPLPQPKFQRNQRFNSRKRRRTTSQGEAAEEGEQTNNADGKKDKKDESMETADAK